MDPEIEMIAKRMMRAEHGDNPQYPTDDILRHYLRYAHLALAAIKELQKEGGLQTTS